MSDANAFADLPRTVATHFRIGLYAALYRIFHSLRGAASSGSAGLEGVLRRYPFLGGYYEEMRPLLPEGLGWDETLAWWESEMLDWEASAGLHLPLAALAEAAGAGFAGRLALLTAGLVEEDPRFGALFAELQAPLAERRPCVELVGRLVLGGPRPGRESDPWSLCRPLLNAGLLAPLDDRVPRSEWVLRVPPPVWDALRGDPEPETPAGCRLHPAASFPALEELVAPPALRTRLRHLPALLESGEAGAAVIRGMRGSDRLRVLGAVAAALGRGVLEVDGGEGKIPEAVRRLIGPLCVATRALPVFTFDLPPGESAAVPDLPGYSGPVGVALGFEGGLSGAALERAVTLVLPAPRHDERRRCWEESLAGHSVAGLDEIAAGFHLPEGHIRRAARIARAQAALDGRSEVRPADVREACRALNRQELDTLASRLETGSSWETLVTSGPTLARLRDLARRCRHRETLADDLGPAFGDGPHRGVRTLFTGPSGTGKTLAARILATELERDLYRVDLAAVVDKYVGETEKNLHRVLARAEELDVVLLLDEGDALLGSRTDVRSANDRYANLETNYLLQRLETFQGIVVITTNAGERIDRAFQRRMDAVVEFLPPEAEERWQIWQIHLPASRVCDPAFLEDVALRCALTGGQIRNAALHAALLALDEGAPVDGRHVEQAVRSEYRKAGAACPLIDRPRGDRRGGMEAFLDALS